MTRVNCHLCGGELYREPALDLRGMPKAAQYYPEPAEFAGDRGIDLPVRQCSACGLVQLDREPVDYYKEVITAATLSPGARQSRLAEVGGLVRQFGLKDKNVLDVGCGKGEMLEVLAEAGLRPTGLEAGAESVAVAQAAGRNVVKGYIGETDELAGAPYDAFICLNYLEHLPEPGRIVRKIGRLTAPGAVGYVTVPNLEYLLGTKCYYEFVADHLSYFTRATLSLAFTANGFEVLDCRTINNDNDLAIEVRRRGPLDLAGQYQEVEELIRQLRELAGRYKKIAVWGAGHRTLALLALAGLKDLAYVIDSARFKQGKFTPVLHLPIVPPDTLSEQPVDLVIVMVPGLYPDEVVKTVRGMGLKSKLASLKGNRIEFVR